MTPAKAEGKRQKPHVCEGSRVCCGCGGGRADEQGAGEEGRERRVKPDVCPALAGDVHPEDNGEPRTDSTCMETAAAWVCVLPGGA